MDVVNVEQAKIAEDSGAVAVMALERVPADIRAQGGVARMSDPDMIDEIMKAVSIPVMAKARIGQFVEAQVLQSLKVGGWRLVTILMVVVLINDFNFESFSMVFSYIWILAFAFFLFQYLIYFFLLIKRYILR